MHMADLDFFDATGTINGIEQVEWPRLSLVDFLLSVLIEVLTVVPTLFAPQHWNDLCSRTNPRRNFPFLVHPASHLFQTLISPQSHTSHYLEPLAFHTPFKNPSRCANRFRLSSLSALDLTKPHSAYTWFSPVYRPFSSTFPTEIWTEAWSLALMMRLVAEHLRGT